MTPTICPSSIWSSCTEGRRSSVESAAGGINKIDATISNVRVHHSATAAFTVNGGAKATVSNSVFSGSAIGVDIEQANTDAPVDSSTISGNTTGIFTTEGAVLQLSNSNVGFNITGLNGTISSFTNNRFVKNGAIGTVTPIGSPTSPTGLQ